MGVVKDENNILLDAKKIIEDIKEKRKNFWLDHWQKGNMTYANEAIKKEFYLPNLNIDSKYLMLCYAGSEEQIIYNGHVSLASQSTPTSRLCRKCKKYEETSYHVASVCEFHKKNLHLMRHNSAVYHIITELCRIMKVKCPLRYPEASGIIKSGDMKIAAGVKYTFGTARIYHNKPDLVWYTPDAIYVLEVSISSLKNVKSQIKMKTARYAVNSTEKLENFAALDNLMKGENFVDILSQKENFKKVKFMPLIFCTYGEIPKETMKHLKELNFTKEKIKTIASSIARLTGRTLKAHFIN
uniref:DUF2797 domain-containing protein n=1 Tax=Strongyloides papillosus TaxID=174720 RepID=A0A0N5C002_STREA